VRNNLHLVGTTPVSRSSRIIGLEFVVDLNVQVPGFLIIRPTFQGTSNTLMLDYSKDLPQVEDRLLPVSVFCVRTCRKSYGLVAGGKFNVEPSDEGMDEIASSRYNLKRSFEGEVGGLDGI